MPVNPLKISFIGKLQSETSHSSVCYGQCVLDFRESAQKFANIHFLDLAISAFLFIAKEMFPLCVQRLQSA